MERLRRALHALLFPPAAVTLLLPLPAFGLLAFVFLTQREEGALAYAAYALSAYALTIVCARLARDGKRAFGRLLSWADGFPLLYRYRTDAAFRTHVSLGVSLGLNLCFAAVKLWCGAHYRSVWFGTLAVYYLTLAVMRFGLLRHAFRTGFGADEAAEYRLCRLVGAVLLAMNAALSGVVILAVHWNEGFVYPGYLIYVMAMYAFYNVIAAVYAVAVSRRHRSPAISAAKAVNLASALVSMLALETAMLAQFGSAHHSAAFARGMTAATGACVCLAVLVMAVWMIVRATCRLRAPARAQDDPDMEGKGEESA